MIKITMLTGPHAGRVRTDEDVREMGFEPRGLLLDMARQDLWWQVDYSRATPEEVLEWGRYDLCARIIRAIADASLSMSAGAILDIPARWGCVPVTTAPSAMGAVPGIRRSASARIAHERADPSSGIYASSSRTRSPTTRHVFGGTICAIGAIGDKPRMPPDAIASTMLP